MEPAGNPVINFEVVYSRWSNSFQLRPPECASWNHIADGDAIRFNGLGGVVSVDIYRPTAHAPIEIPSRPMSRRTIETGFMPNYPGEDQGLMTTNDYRVFYTTIKQHPLTGCRILYIPSGFIKKNGLVYRREEMVMVTTNLGHYSLKVVPNNGTYIFGQGWIDFAKGFKLKVGDQVKFTLVNHATMNAQPIIIFNQ